MAAGQGETAKARLQDRLPFCGLVLSEAHARKLEIMLTEYVLEQFKTESSTHYRPDCVEHAAKMKNSRSKRNKRRRRRRRRRRGTRKRKRTKKR